MLIRLASALCAHELGHLNKEITQLSTDRYYIDDIRAYASLYFGKPN